MIDYRFPEEKEIMLYYAKLLKDSTAENIITKGEVSNSSEAAHLAKFFWLMVDQSVKDIEQGKDAAGHRDLAAWNEYTLQTIRSYLRGNGYESEWEAADV